MCGSQPWWSSLLLVVEAVQLSLGPSRPGPSPSTPLPLGQGLLATSVGHVLWHVQVCACLCPLYVPGPCGEGLPQAACSLAWSQAHMKD